MNHINQLQKRIMRRVYYAYALRWGTHPAMLSVVLFVVSVYVLSRLVHVASIIQNIQAVQVGQLHNYIINMIMNAELWTLIALGTVIFSALSIPLSLKPDKHSKMQTV